ncbi:MAG: ribbon-helix-helix domain-containing protein [Bacteroidales bacterium]|jgi:metal-responsive CopG/Arc/MetJ family transcriptional regulator|nr:ribbon-helix-helix domain-containing protein [Bacteroidales bacterium]
MKRPGFNNDKLKRRHRKSMLFNDAEMEAIDRYCKKYKIKNRSKFMREAIIAEVLHKFENDHPKLFEY